jgi:hypothetical protein
MSGGGVNVHEYNQNKCKSCGILDEMGRFYPGHGNIALTLRTKRPLLTRYKVKWLRARISHKTIESYLKYCSKIYTNSFSFK